MRRSRSLFLIGLLYFSNMFYFAQSRIWDAGARGSFLLKYDVNTKSFFTMRSRFLQTENFTQTKRATFDIGYWYKMNPAFRISVHYMYRLHRLKDSYFSPMHRYYIRIDYTYLFNKFFDIKNRLMLQHTTHRFLIDIQDNGYEPFYRTDVRERVGASYNLSSKESLYFQDEVLVSLSSPTEIRRNRIYFGYKKVINEKWRTKIYFMVQSTFNKKNSPNYNYLIVGWDWIFKWN